jgi:hypothetical protein
MKDKLVQELTSCWFNSFAICPYNSNLTLSNCLKRPGLSSMAHNFVCWQMHPKELNVECARVHTQFLTSRPCPVLYYRHYRIMQARTGRISCFTKSLASKPIIQTYVSFSAVIYQRNTRFPSPPRPDSYRPSTVGPEMVVLAVDFFATSSWEMAGTCPLVMGRPS